MEKKWEITSGAATFFAFSFFSKGVTYSPKESNPIKTIMFGWCAHSREMALRVKEEEKRFVVWFGFFWKGKGCEIFKSTHCVWCCGERGRK